MATYVNPGITTPTDFRFIAKCTPSGLSDTTTVMTTSINPVNQCYCVPSGMFILTKMHLMNLRCIFLNNHTQLMFFI